MPLDIRIKRIYDAPEPDDGLRVLVTTYWPRGVNREAVPRWERSLGVPAPLLRLWLDGQLPRCDFERGYRDYLGASIEAQQALRALLKAAPARITLLTSLKELDRSHLPILRTVLSELAGGSDPPGSPAGA